MFYILTLVSMCLMCSMLNVQYCSSVSMFPFNVFYASIVAVITLQGLQLKMSLDG